MPLPPAARDLIDRRASEIPYAALERACAALSAHYRDRRSTASAPLPASGRVTAYLVTRLPATFAACHEALAEVRRLLPSEPHSLLDLGAGAGAAALAAGQIFPALAPVTLAESDPAFAPVARELLPDSHALHFDLRSRADLPPHDLVVASYVLGEISPRDLDSLVGRAWLAARQALVLIEPGTPAGFELIRHARDHLLTQGASMIAPCPSASPCPLNPPDWCHFAARVERSSLHRRLKHGTLGYEDEKFSYVALSRETAAPVPARIIRRPLHHPGRVDLTVCHGAYIESPRVNRRDKAAFRAARKAAWGDSWPPTVATSE